MSDGNTEHPAEDPRIARARDLLAESTAATEASPVGAARWWGRFETALGQLLTLIDERAGQRP
jgi:hypothetical protein